MTNKKNISRVCKRIRECRKESGLTLPALSKKAGISQGNLSKIENGPCNVGLETLYKLAKAIGINVNKFFHKL